MIFPRRLLLACLFLVLLAVHPGAAQPTSGQPAPAPPSVQTAEPASAAQAYSLPPDKLAKAIALSRIRNLLDITGSVWGIAFLWILLATRWVAALETWAERVSRRRWLQGMLFFAAFLLLTALANLPLDVYGHHVSRAYGISVEGWAGWLADLGKSLGISLLIGAPLLLLFHWIVRRWPRRFWLGAWLITLPLMVLGAFLQPLVIDPLFNKFEPLEKTNPALVQQLEKVVTRTGIDIPPSRMFLMKASAKTNGLNAYVTGIGTSTRIVVWDTTAGRIPDDEILFIFAHETGHYVLHHIRKGLAITAVLLFFGYWACAGFAGWLVRRCGARWGIDSLRSRAGFVVLLLAVSLAGWLAEPLGNAISRYFEHQADVYGQEALHGIVPDPQKTAVAAFNALGQAWLEDPHPSPFIEFWLYNHPSTQIRATFAAHYDPWTDGGHGQYFKH